MITVTSNRHSGSSLLTLIREIQNLGVEIPDELSAEAEIFRTIAKDQDPAQVDFEAAIQNLYSVDAAKFDGAVARVVDAKVRQAAAQDMRDTLTGAAVHRLRGKVLNEIRSWETAVVDPFNETVEHFRLNEVAAELPNFSDPKSFNVMSMSGNQGRAIDQWRNAVAHLQPLWSLYGRLVRERGDQLLGPAGAGDFSTNAITACALGTPDNFGQIQSAAVMFASINDGADSVKSYGPLLPFIVPINAGYQLRLNKIHQAAGLKNRLQQGAALSRF